MGEMEQQQQQMMMMRQQQMMQQQPMMQQPNVNPAENAQMLQMQNEMAQMKKQNELLTQMVQNQVSQRRNVVAKAAPQYTHSGLAKYFKNKHLNAAMLKKDLVQRAIADAVAMEARK